MTFPPDSKFYACQTARKHQPQVAVSPPLVRKWGFQAPEREKRTGPGNVSFAPAIGLMEQPGT